MSLRGGAASIDAEILAREQLSSELAWQILILTAANLESGLRICPGD